MRGIFDRAFGEAKNAQVLDMLPEFLLWGPSKSGQSVTYETALRASTVLACCRVLCNGVAQVPWRVMKARPSGTGGDPDRTHPLYPLLNRRPNDWQTSFEFRQQIVLHLTLAGNAFVYISRGGGGRILELIPLEPGRVTVTRHDDMSLTYLVTAESGAQRRLLAADIWHIRGLSWNGWLGLEGVKLAREAIGLGMALEESHARLAKNGAQTSGTYAVEGKLTDDQFVKLTKWIKKHATGENAGGPLILDNGAKWLTQQMTGVDAEHLATRQFQVVEQCRTLNVQPMMVFAVDKPTYASAEQLFIAHEVHTMHPLRELIEQSADVHLLRVDNDGGHYTHLDEKNMLRGSMKDRAEYNAKALGSGGSRPWMTQDEVRDNDDLPPMGGKAAELLEPPSASKAPATTPDPNEDVPA